MFLSICNSFWWMVIKIWCKLVKLQLILMNGHGNQKQIGQNNHLQTLFHTHCYILSNWKNVHQNPITSKHYFTLSKKLQAKPSQECKRVWERKKYGLALSSHFNGSSKLCAPFLISVNILMELYPPPPPILLWIYFTNNFRWTVISVEVAY